MSTSPRTIVIGVGNELLLGRTVDTNAGWLGRELSAMGLPVHRHLVVGDASEEIEDALQWGLDSGEVVLVTGGLGPTRDDRTKAAAARATGRPLHRDEAVLAGLLERSRALGRPDPSTAHLDQANVPEGAQVVANALGSAPGLILEVDDRVLVLLPGVPFEMKRMFGEGVAPFLRKRFGDSLHPVHVRSLHTVGIPESVLAERIAEVLPPEPGPVEVAFLPRLGTVELRLTVRALAHAEAEARLDRVENEVAPLLEPYRYQAESGDIAEAVADALTAGGRTVSVAESCTGGLLGKRLTDREGASGYFAGGIIAYADEVKIRELAVAPDLLQRVGAVSESTARAMALGVARRFRTDVGVAITGIAGPGGGSDEKPVGTVWYAVSVGREVDAGGERFPGGRDEIRERSVHAVMALLLKKLKHD